MIISEHYKVWGGPRPANLADLRAEGIKRIISLEAGVYQALKVYENERDSVMFQFPCEFGMAEYNMPMSAIQAPDKDYVDKILKLVADGMPTFIHCEHGQDRTGFVGAVIKMRYEGWTYKQALEWWSAFRHWQYFVWDKELEKWGV